MNFLTNWLSHSVINWKTTLTGMVGGIALILNAFNVVTISAENQRFIIGAAVVIIGFFAKDGNVSGTIDDTNPVIGTATLDKDYPQVKAGIDIDKGDN